jgi:arylsulfatase A-like enzyme
MNNLPTILVGALSLAFLGTLHAVDASQSTAKPNIVVILADDLGYGDLQCYNPERGKIPTPHLDQLASQGMRFTDGHSSSGVCSPSRYTLLTGRYHWRTRLQSGIVGTWGEPLIAPDRLTIASLAKQHGYRTAMVGKWHLGWNWPIKPEQKPFMKGRGIASEKHRAVWQEVFSQPIPGGPTTRGFDSYFGTDVPNWPPYCFIENDRTVGIPSEFLPDKLLGNNQASVAGPALKDWKLEPTLPALGDRVCQIIAECAAKPEPFLIYMPLTTPHTPLAVNNEWKDKSGLNNACADLIMETDAVVGRVLAALEKSGKADNTLVFFSSDNGFATYAGAKDLETRGHFPSGPLRGYKTEVHEGGHREPFIIRWPGVVKPGSVCHQLVHHADLLATITEILGTKLPDNAGEDSFSMLPLLKGEDQPIREHAVSCAASGIPGIRQGSWKLILSRDPNVPKNQPAPDVRLYNLANDLAETNDVSSFHPEQVKQMMTLYEKLIADGRSTPGEKQANDVEVRRYTKTLSVPTATPE